MRVRVQGLVYLVRHGLVEDRASDIARFLHGARRIDRFQERRILEARADLLDEYVLYCTLRASTDLCSIVSRVFDRVRQSTLMLHIIMLSFT